MEIHLFGEECILVLEIMFTLMIWRLLSWPVSAITCADTVLAAWAIEPPGKLRKRVSEGRNVGVVFASTEAAANSAKRKDARGNLLRTSCTKKGCLVFRYCAYHLIKEESFNSRNFVVLHVYSLGTQYFVDLWHQKLMLKLSKILLKPKQTLWLASLAIEVNCIESHINIYSLLVKKNETIGFFDCCCF